MENSCADFDWFISNHDVAEKISPPMMAGFNLAPANAINTMCSVTIVTWLTMPILVNAFQWWLIPKKIE
jgi:antibiotic biosynthesis monooxygenase (ABM) superfamily enzyme